MQIKDHTGHWNCNHDYYVDVIVSISYFRASYDVTRPPMDEDNRSGIAELRVQVALLIQRNS